MKIYGTKTEIRKKIKPGSDSYLNTEVFGNDTRKLPGNNLCDTNENIARPMKIPM